MNKPMTAWVVVFSNYYPAEVDSIWKTKELAEQKADELQGDWHVQEWTVQETNE